MEIKKLMGYYSNFYRLKNNDVINFSILRIDFLARLPISLCFRAGHCFCMAFPPPLFFFKYKSSKGTVCILILLALNTVH